MITEIRRLEHAIQATEIPTHIARDCLGNRQRRIDTDLVQDDAENQLLKVNYLDYVVASILNDTLVTFDHIISLITFIVGITTDISSKRYFD